MFLCTTFIILYSPIRLHLVWEDIFTTCFLQRILTCYSMQLKNAGACIWISLQLFTLKYIMDAYDGTLYLEPTLVSQTSGHFQLMFVTHFAVNVLKCTDTHVQAYNSMFVIMVILGNGCIFLWIAFTRLFVYLNWVNLLCRSIWPHCPYLVQCNTVYVRHVATGDDGLMRHAYRITAPLWGQSTDYRWIPVIKGQSYRPLLCIPYCDDKMLLNRWVASDFRRHDAQVTPVQYSDSKYWC